MKYILEIPQNKSAFAEEFFKSISFVKKVKAIPKNKITNSSILKSIEEYENQEIIPTAIEINKLKKLLHA